MDGNSQILLQLLASNVTQEATLTAMYNLQLAEYAKNHNQNFNEVKKIYDATILRIQGEISIKLATLIATLNPEISSLFNDFVNKAKEDSSGEGDNQ